MNQILAHVSANKLNILLECIQTVNLYTLILKELISIYMDRKLTFIDKTHFNLGFQCQDIPYIPQIIFMIPFIPNQCFHFNSGIHKSENSISIVIQLLEE
jgi:hypothetical protein